jgi:hypothetical protein
MLVVPQMSLISSKRKTRLAFPASDQDGLRPDQAAEYKNVSVGTIYNWLPLLKTWTVTRPGSKRGMRFISRASLDELVSKMTKEGL